ncbi:hypothetical protein ACH4JS_13575 [Streptomyces sp. NPDC017638]|uniref:hypothetical protein n=1 Tax=Streptomyces sp. NPDC017638 TaxID=3365004 RepID=UPI0037BCF8EC
MYDSPSSASSSAVAGIASSRPVGRAVQSTIRASAAFPEVFISEVVHQPPDW